MTSPSSLEHLDREPHLRKLMVVAHADMVGYSRLIERDDIGTLRRMRALRRALINPSIRSFGGKTVQIAGDSLLIIFESVEAAVRCAVNIQQQIHLFDEEQSNEAKIRFRIGVSIGDLVADSTGFHGDAVNIAARLQKECPAGGVCISGVAHAQVQRLNDLKFESLGPLFLKNISRPVDAYLLRIFDESFTSEECHDSAITSQKEAKPIGQPAPVKRKLILNNPWFIFLNLALMLSLGISMVLSLSVITSTLAVAALAISALATVGPILASQSWKWIAGQPLADQTLPTNSIKVYEKSNDFLAAGGELQFPNLLESTKHEAWFVGATFYISTGQYRDLILRKLSEGVDINFLVLNPIGAPLHGMSSLLGVTSEELKLDCTSGLRLLARTAQEARRLKLAGVLRARLLNEIMQPRLYLFDPKQDHGHIFFVPQINGVNSQTIPGFLAKNAHAPFHKIYFESILKLWTSSNTISAEDWISENPPATH